MNATPSHHFRGLLIEDSPETVVLVDEVLRPECSIDSAGSLREAKGLSDTRDYQFFIVDLNLPDGSGFDFCRMIRQNPRPTNQRAAMPINDDAQQGKTFRFRILQFDVQWKIQDKAIYVVHLDEIS